VAAERGADSECRLVITLSPAGLAQAVTANGLRLGTGTAAMFLEFWLEPGLVVEVFPAGSV
jgi:hypothetical protein